MSLTTTSSVSMSPSQTGAPRSVLTNAFPLLTGEANYYLYSVHIEVDVGGRNPLPLSTGFGVKKMTKKGLCQAIMASLLPKDLVYSYAGEELLVAPTKIEGLNIVVPLAEFAECPANLSKFHATVIMAELKEVSPSEIESEYVPSVLESILSSMALSHGYKKISRGQYLLPTASSFHGTYLLTEGYQISVKPIESGGFAAFIDPKVFILYPNRLVAHVVAFLTRKASSTPSEAEMGRYRFDHQNLDLISRYFIGTNVVLKDGSDRFFKVIDIKHLDLRSFKVDGKEGPVLLKDTFNFLKSKLLTWPVLEVESRSGNRYLPMDLVELAEFQRLPSTNPCHKQDYIVLRPDMREHHLAETIRRMGIAGRKAENPWLNAFNIQIGERIRPVALNLPAPEISYNRRLAFLNEETRAWNQGRQFDRGGSTDIFVVLAISDGQETTDKVYYFAEWYVEQCRSMGIQMPPASEMNFVNRPRFSADWLEQQFQLTEEETDGHKKKAFLLYIDPIYVDSQRLLKQLERKHCVFTQHVTLKIAMNAWDKKQRKTLGNIMAKTNLKLGGNNYTVNPKNHGVSIASDRWQTFLQTTLILGADVCRPVGVPATVGLCTNAMTADPLYFTGDFRYQAPRQEHIDDAIMEEFMIHVFKNYRSTRGTEPQHVLYLRDGVNESQHSMILREVEAIRSALNAKGCFPTITALLVVKRHNTRILTVGGQNPGPGLVVDSGITHPVIPDFYLQAHKALLGTAKAPLYRELVNEGGYKEVEIYDICHLLSYAIGICTSPVSLPAPVYGAHEFAKRGNYMQPPRYLQVSIGQMTRDLCYKGTPLEKARINA